MNESGIWSQVEADKYHQSSPKLAQFLEAFLPIEETVIDFGCGNAYYLSKLAEAGFECIGVEGNKLNNFLFDNIAIHDLTLPIQLVAKGSVISLEVGEHLPPSAEQTFINTITFHCTGYLVLSWALVGQPGVGHWNCRPQEYIKKEICKRGFEFMPDATKEARASVDKNTDWFERTLLIFKKV